ncbi:PhoX family protein [Neoroseomonas oryzicola]|uniref:PhoX family phosphatase n=1 Tax=Neoroseomonas oryzicola TaxID=535904 RepID=A0A9X9WD81_9PROT|nr:PhoX family phosphatase [Neoroseomonas oryzicola]MBR0658291.1 PhoX family phosphatase [Neoroseomonas oryzicola]NKE18456.1 PhoX family phosphatase [Neoroseomonas oryzicola]
MPDAQRTEEIDIEALEDVGANPDPRRPIGEVIAARYGRRSLLAAGAAAAAIAALPGDVPAQTVAPREGGPSTLTFPELRHRLAQTDAVAEGYERQVVIRWGDPVLPGAPPFDPRAVTEASQAKQFGYNCDYLDYFPLPMGSRTADHGLLVVNHEYTNTNLIFPGMGSGREARTRSSGPQTRAELMAHGLSVVEVKREGNAWSYVKDSPRNRRITGETPMRVAGPAAGAERMKTKDDPTGMRVLGTLNNCAGGNTPWGTVLTGEENTNYYFGGDPAKTPHQAIMRRYGIVNASLYNWWRHQDRFDVEKEPNESFRFGWVVEFDPYDPESVPVKRTALGRFKHEGATHAVSADGRVVIYSGDDERFEYVYKFVTARPWNPNDRAANRDLLDEGTLYAGKFLEDGKVEWLPLVFGQGPLTAANGFASQADVLIETRRAADLLGATPMDRPEDVETNPVNGRVYVMLTNNSRRTAQQAGGANPRPRNIHGHVLEIIPPGAGTDRVDHAATEARWALFIAAGKPGIDAGAQYHRATSDDGWLSCPDNCAFDSKGRIWIATDGAPANAGVADGLYAADTAGFGRALTRLFYQAPTGAEVCGPRFTPDDRTIFLAIQHPGEDAGSTFERPSTRWPDFAEGMPPRPSVIAIVRKDGGPIGD